MVKKKKINRAYFWTSSSIFIISSIMLFTNTLTDFFKNLNITLNITLIAWIGIVFSLIWWMILVSNKQRFWSSA